MFKRQYADIDTKLSRNMLLDRLTRYDFKPKVYRSNPSWISVFLFEQDLDHAQCFLI